MNQSREDRLASEVASRLAGCPDAETLATFQEGRLDAAGHRGIEGHVKRCTPCRQAVAFLEQSGAIEEFPQPLPSEVERRSDQLLQGIGSSSTRRPSPWPMMLQIAAGLTLVAALAVGGFSLLGPGRSPSDLGSLRGDEPLSLLFPSGITAETPTELRWVAHPDATRYRIEILNENLEEIWSGQTSGAETVLVVDSTGLDLLIPGRMYIWRVVAQDEFGATVGASPAAQFEISPP